MDPAEIDEALERQRWLEAPAQSLQSLVDGAFRRAGARGTAVKDFLHGVWLGHPLHPVLTDVPIGAWTVALVLDAREAAGGRSSLSRCADAAVAVGVVGALCAAAAGLADWSPYAEKAPRRLGLAHAALNTAATSLFAVSWDLRRRRLRPAGRTAAMAGGLLALVAAYIGGSLVYRQKVGVNHAPDAGEPMAPAVALPVEELPEGAVKVVRLGGQDVLLARVEGRIYAMANRCSHYGGPLNEGQLQGCSVQCPWHGSVFNLATGAVERGPATFSQPCYTVAVREGRIEISRSPGGAPMALPADPGTPAWSSAAPG